MRLANMPCWMYLTATEDICWGFCGAPELLVYTNTCCSSATNPRAGVSYSHTASLYLLDWLYCQMGLQNMQRLICCNETYDRTENFPEYLNVVEVCCSILLTSKYVGGLRFPVDHEFGTDKRLESRSGIMLNVQVMSFIVRVASRERVIWFINWLHFIMVIINDWERQWNPPPTIPTSDLWFASKWHRERISLCSIVCLTNNPCDNSDQLRWVSLLTAEWGVSWWRILTI